MIHLTADLIEYLDDLLMAGALVEDVTILAHAWVEKHVPEEDKAETKYAVDDHIDNWELEDSGLITDPDVGDFTDEFDQED